MYLWTEQPNKTCVRELCEETVPCPLAVLSCFTGIGLHTSDFCTMAKQHNPPTQTHRAELDLSSTSSMILRYCCM